MNKKIIQKFGGVECIRVLSVAIVFIISSPILITPISSQEAD